MFNRRKGERRKNTEAAEQPVGLPGELKLCPFCSGEARIGKESYKALGGDTRQKTQVFCGNCFAMVDVLETDRDFDGKLALGAVTEKWNKRKPERESSLPDTNAAILHLIRTTIDAPTFIDPVINCKNLTHALMEIEFMLTGKDEKKMSDYKGTEGGKS